MARPFKALRVALMDADIQQGYLARQFRVSTNTITARMNGHKPWTLDEMYRVMDLLRLPYAQLHVYFPKDGKAEVRGGRDQWTT